ncbi:MAG: protein kinase [Pirellulales bacterium]
MSQEHVGRSTHCPACKREITIGDTTSETPPAKPSSNRGSGETLPSVSNTNDTRVTAERIGRFEIKQQLGAGAFGEVYRAYDRTLDREVALKVPKATTVSSTRAMDRFLREAKAAAQLRHPHIVPVYDAGQTDGRYYIASAFINGQPLSDLIADEPLDFHRAAAVVRALAEALAYAHEQGVIHRDIKPDNVMVDQSGQPHIMDFGLARFHESTDKVTQDGTVLGTAAYMAPEQARGELDQVGPASDQYSLGVVLYELLTGQTPFSGPPQIVLFHVLETEPAAPRAARPDLPLDLETICLRAMAKEAGQRYANCAELADDLRRFLENEPIAARRLSTTERMVRWCRRNPVSAGLTAALFGALVLGASVSTLFAFQAASRATLAQREAKRADDETQRAEGEKEKAKNEANAARLAEAEATREAEAARIAEEKATQALDKARQREYIASMLVAAGDWERANLSRMAALLEQQIPLHGETDLRHFEWYYWRKRLSEQGSPRYAGGVGGRPALSSNGDLLAIAQRMSIRLFDVETGNARDHSLGTLPGNAAFYARVATSSDGKLFAATVPGEPRKESANSSTTLIEAIELWEAASGEKKLSISVQVPAISGMVLSPDGGLLVAACQASDTSDRYIIRVWNATTGDLLHELPESRLSKLSGENLTVSFDNRWLAGPRLKEGELAVWDLNSGEMARTILGPGISPVYAVFRPGTSEMAVTCTDGAIRIWNAATGAFVAALLGHSGVSGSVEFSNDGRRLVTVGAQDHTLRVWDVETRKTTHVLPMRGVMRVAFRSDGNEIVAACINFQGRTGFTVVKFDVSSSEQFQSYSGNAQPNTYCLDNRRIVFDGIVRDLATGEKLVTLQDADNSPQATAFSQDGHRIAGFSKQAIHVWDAVTGKPVGPAFDPSSADKIVGVNFSPDGSRLLSKHDRTVAVGKPYTYEVRLWDATNGKQLFAVPARTSTTCISSDSRWGAVDPRDGPFAILDIRTGEAVKTLDQCGGATCGQFAPDGKSLAVGKRDGTIAVMDITTGEATLTLQGHTNNLSSITYSGDGRRLASNANDGTVRLWDVQSGYELLSWKGLDGRLEFSPDGQWLAVGSRDKITLLEAPRPPQAAFDLPASPRAGQRLAFEAAPSTIPSAYPLSYQWKLADEPVSQDAVFSRVFHQSGDYSLSLAVTNGRAASSITKALRVLPIRELGTEDSAGQWACPPENNLQIAFDDGTEEVICGKTALHATVDPYHGAVARILYPKSRDAGLSLQGKTQLGFWIKAATSSPVGWQNTNPIVVLHESDEKAITYTPAANWLKPPGDDGRLEWRFVAVPLAGDEQWNRNGDAQTINWLTIGVDSWDAPPLQIWIDGLSLE